MYRSVLAIFFLSLATLPLNAQNKFNYPVTEKGPQVDTYFGQQVADPYRWLEDDRSEKTGAWVKKENTITEEYLKKIYFRDKIKARLTEIWNYNKQSVPFKKGNSFFCYKNNGLQNQSVLYIQKSLDDAGEILLDPNTLSKDGTVSLSASPSPPSSWRTRRTHRPRSARSPGRCARSARCSPRRSPRSSAGPTSRRRSTVPPSRRTT